MRTSELIELTNPSFTGFVIGTVQVSPGLFRLRRIPPRFLGLPGPVGPAGAIGAVGPAGPVGPAGATGSSGTLTANVKRAQFGITIDGGGVAITTGIKGYLRVPKSLTIAGWEITADQAGSIVVDVWKVTYANYPPTVANTIAASAKPTLSSALKNQNLTLTGWTTTVTAGDYIGFKVDSAATVQLVQVSIFGDIT